jgi:hypothetical protein
MPGPNELCRHPGAPIFSAFLEQTTTEEGGIMADNLDDRGPQDRSRINVNESWELRYWTRHFGVSEEQLRAAVNTAGTSVEAVGKQLGK